MECGAEGEHEGGQATLYVVATPIGNLKDITLRAIEVLSAVDVIAAEDTRVTARLLSHHGIASKTLVALHEHNEQRTLPRILGHLAAGRSVALASDAGTPAFSDPGARLVAAAHESGYAVVPIPGANAAAAALSASGVQAPHFLFYGFLAARRAERRGALQKLALLPYALIFYEAPHRVLEMIGDCAEVLGGHRGVVIARELTKLFETIHVCRLDEAAAWLAADAHRTKGEFVLIVEGARSDAHAVGPEARRALEILLEDLPVKQASALASRITGVGKNDLYALALELKASAE